MSNQKDALGFIELTYSFVMYQQKINGYTEDLKSFIAHNMTKKDIEKMSVDGAFFANSVRGKEIYGLCHKYNMPWENLNWVNSFRHPKEAEAIFKEIEKFPGDYAQKVYAWAQTIRKKKCTETVLCQK